MLKKNGHVKESAERGFTRLMAEGKVRKALRLIDANSEIAGVHTLDDKVRDELRRKHPGGEPARPEAIIQGDAPVIQEVIFEDTTSEAIQSAAMNVNGSGGPTMVDAEIWKHSIRTTSFWIFKYNFPLD